MSLSAAFWCSVFCFRICLDFAGLEDFALCSMAHIDVSKAGQSHKALRKMGSPRMQTGRTLQRTCHHAQQLPPVQQWQIHHMLCVKKKMQLHCHGGVLPSSFLTKPKCTTSTVIFFSLNLLENIFTTLSREHKLNSFKTLCCRATREMPGDQASLSSNASGTES